MLVPAASKKLKFRLPAMRQFPLPSGLYDKESRVNPIDRLSDDRELIARHAERVLGFFFGGRSSAFGGFSASGR